MKIELIKGVASTLGENLIANNKGKISDELNLIAMADEELGSHRNES